MNHSTTRRLTVSAVMLALSTVLAAVCELIPFFNLPFGGGFTIASALPVIIVSYMYGVKHGLFTAFAYALIQVAMDLMMGGKSTIKALFLPNSDSYQGIAAAIFILLIDYLIAYTCLGFGGLFRNRLGKTGALCVGSIVALALRYAAHVISGAIFYGAWAEWFFTDTIAASWGISKWVMANVGGGLLSVVYSLVYNGCYMLPEILITAVAATIVARIPNIRKVEK